MNVDIAVLSYLCSNLCISSIILISVQKIGNYGQGQKSFEARIFKNIHLFQKKYAIKNIW